MLIGLRSRHPPARQVPGLGEKGIRLSTDIGTLSRPSTGEGHFDDKAYIELGRFVMIASFIVGNV